MDWAAVSSFGAKAVAKLTEAGKLAEEKLEEAKIRTQPPIQVGQYRLVKLKKLADGGFSEVFLARDADGDDTFALKRMVCQTAASKTDAKSELKLLKAFGAHPNLIAVLGASARGITVPGQRVESMEVHFLFPLYPDGTVFDVMWSALEQKRNGGGGHGSSSQGFGSNGGGWPFPEPVLLRVASGVAKGLKAMHDKGYAHLDMKPHNVMLAPDGTPVIMDLGSAAPHRRDVASRQDAHKLEDDASVKCSAPYRSPELTEVRHPAALDLAAADAWSLGCTLFAMAFDAWSPFESELEGVKRLAILNGKYAYPASKRNALGCVYSDDLCALLDRLLSADPAARPSMAELRCNLNCLAKHEPLPAPEPKGSNGARSNSGGGGGGGGSGSTAALKQYLTQKQHEPPPPPWEAVPPPAAPPAAAPAVRLQSPTPAAPPDLLDFFDAAPTGSGGGAAPASAALPGSPFDAFAGGSGGGLGALTGSMAKASLAPANDFGDFGDFVTAEGSDAPTTISNTGNGGNSSGSDFESFGAFQQPPPMQPLPMQPPPIQQQQQQLPMAMAMAPMPFVHMQQSAAPSPYVDPFVGAAAPPAEQAPAPKSTSLDALNPFEGL